jgi:hypothetical protein
VNNRPVLSNPRDPAADSPTVRRRRFRAAAALLVISAMGLSCWLSFRAPMGETLPTSQPGVIVPSGSDLGPFTSDPPTSGAHYSSALRPGFYDPQAAATLPRFPVGFLVANLEQGDVVLWYSCAGLSDGACQDLQAQIRMTMHLMGPQGLIAFPWPSLTAPVVLTSWGHRLSLPTYDLKQAIGFIFAHRGHGPQLAATAAPGS